MAKVHWTEVWEQMTYGPRVILHLRHTESDIYEVLDPQANHELVERFETEDDAERWLRKNDFIYLERRTPAPDGQGPDIVSKFEPYLTDEDDPDAEKIEPTVETTMQLFGLTREHAEWMLSFNEHQGPRCCVAVEPDTAETQLAGEDDKAQAELKD